MDEMWCPSTFGICSDTYILFAYTLNYELGMLSATTVTWILLFVLERNTAHYFYLVSTSANRFLLLDLIRFQSSIGTFHKWLVVFYLTRANFLPWSVVCPSVSFSLGHIFMRLYKPELHDFFYFTVWHDFRYIDNLLPVYQIVVFHRNRHAIKKKFNTVSLGNTNKAFLKFVIRLYTNMLYLVMDYQNNYSSPLQSNVENFSLSPLEV